MRPRVITPAGREPRRILVVRLGALGDVVHLTGCLRAIRTAYPAAEISMVIERRLAAIARASPHVDRVLEAGPPSVPPFRQWLHARRLLRLHEEPPFDLAIDFQGQRRSAAWVYASRARRKVGRGGVRPGWHVICRPRREQHAVLRCREVMEAAGIPVDDPSPELVCSASADDALAEHLVAAGIPAEGFVLVNPFSRWRSKEWPLERYATLIDAVVADLRRPVVVSGGPEEVERGHTLQRLLAFTTTVTSLVGALPLEQALCLYRRAAVMVTGDSGPMHAAAAVGTRVVALFGPTLPERSGPWGPGHVVLQMRRPADQRAFRRDPEAWHIRGIDVPMAIDAVTRALATPRAGSRQAQMRA